MNLTPNPAPPADSAAKEAASPPLAAHFKKMMDSEKSGLLGGPKGQAQENDLLRAAAELARRVSGPELDEEQYVAQMSHLRVSARNRQAGGGLADVEAAFLESGALLASRMGQQGGMAVCIAFKEPGRWLQTLPQDPRWHLATCEEAFAAAGPGNRYALALARAERTRLQEEGRAAAAAKAALAGAPAGALVEADALEELDFWERKEAALRKAKDDVEWAEAARLLADRADAKGRLETLIQNGRGKAWLMHALLAAPIELARRAMAAGATLSGATPQERRDFFEAMMRSRESEAHRYLSKECAGQLKTPEQKKRHAELQEEDGAQMWDRWALAIEAGLPPLTWKGASANQCRQVSGGFSHPLAQAILAQEALRPESHGGEGLAGSVEKMLWARASSTASWPESVAQRAGAKKGESAMAWGFRHGLPKTGWSPYLMLRALCGDGADCGSAGACFTRGAGRDGVGSERLADTAVGFAEAGVRLEGAETQGSGLARAAIRRKSGCPPEQRIIADALVKMGADFAFRPTEGGEMIPRAFLEALAGFDAKGCRIALEAAERSSPGMARKMLAEAGDEGENAVHWAMRGLSVEAMQMCLDFGADLGARDRKGRTGLHWAARRYGKQAQAKLLPVVEWLHARGFDFSATDDIGQTAVAIMAKKGPVDALVRILEAAPQLLEQKDRAGKSAMGNLAKRGGEGLPRAESAVMAQELKAAAQTRHGAQTGAGGSGHGEAQPAQPPASRRAARRM